MSDLRSRLIRLAYDKPETRASLLPLLQKTAIVFDTKKQFDTYMEEHPDADQAMHSIDEKAEGKKKDKPKDKPKKSILDVDEANFDDSTEASKEDVAKFKDHPSVKHLGEDFNLTIVAGADGELTRGDLYRAVHVADHLAAGIDDATDYCKVNPPACKGNLGITRDNMPQLMDKTVADLLASDDEAEKRKGQAAVDAGADPESDKTVQDLWIEHMEKQGIKVTESDQIEVGKLIASQAEIKAKKSYGIAKSYLTGQFDKLPDLPILVARDPETGEVTVIDGHHRYAGLLTADPTKKMTIRVIEAPIRKALEMAFEVPGVFRADLQDKIVDGDKPLDIARKPGSTWKQSNGKWYGKTDDGDTGGPFKGEEKAKEFSSGQSKKEARLLLHRVTARYLR